MYKVLSIQTIKYMITNVIDLTTVVAQDTINWKLKKDALRLVFDSFDKFICAKFHYGYVLGENVWPSFLPNFVVIEQTNSAVRHLHYWRRHVPITANRGV